MGGVSFQSPPIKLPDGTLMLRAIGTNGMVSTGSDQHPILLKVKNNKIFLTVEIFDKDGKIVGEMIDNTWKVNVNNYFRLNFDDNAVEIIDQSNRVSISVELIDDRTISIFGALNRGDDGWIFVNSRGLSFMGSYKSAKMSGREDEWESRFNYNKTNIPRIFSYEGLDYLGKRVRK